jgi:hypothetical protein
VRLSVCDTTGKYSEWRLKELSIVIDKKGMSRQGVGYSILQ